MSRNNSLLDRQFTITLYSASSCLQCHRIRLALAEKELEHKVLLVDTNSKHPELAELNPYNSVPTLVDRDITLYDPRVILEYLDERFPHPSLIPSDPVSRARWRMAMFHIEVDWYGHIKKLSSSSKRVSSEAKKILRETLLAHTNDFKAFPYFMSDEFSALDCSLAPVFWRLPSLGVKMPVRKNHPIREYTKRIFERPAFRKSLTEAEAELQDIK